MIIIILRNLDKAHKALYEKKGHCSVINGKMREKGSNQRPKVMVSWKYSAPNQHIFAWNPRF